MGHLKYFNCSPPPLPPPPSTTTISSAASILIALEEPNLRSARVSQPTCVVVVTRCCKLELANRELPDSVHWRPGGDCVGIFSTSTRLPWCPSVIRQPLPCIYTARTKSYCSSRRKDCSSPSCEKRRLDSIRKRTRS